MEDISKIIRRTSPLVRDININLNKLIIKAEDSYLLEDLLRRTIISLYRQLFNKKKIYYGRDSEIGYVTLRMNPNHGFMDIEYLPSSGCKTGLNYDGIGLGTVNLKENQYNIECIYKEKLPKRLIKDTEKVMELLGLKRETKK